MITEDRELCRQSRDDREREKEGTMTPNGALVSRTQNIGEHWRMKNTEHWRSCISFPFCLFGYLSSSVRLSILRYTFYEVVMLQSP